MIMWYHVLYISTMECYLTIKKQTNTGNLAICDNIDESEGRYAKWNKTVTAKQILHDYIYIRYLK